MTTKKLIPLLIALLGLALIIAAIVVWFEPPKDGGVFNTAGAIISFLVGAGASIKGWKDLFKKDELTNSIKQEMINRSDTSTPIQAQTVNIYQNTPNPQSLPNHQSSKNSLPSQPYFFGRADELKIIASALSPDSRTWGALIDGPGGIGKTALAIKAAHDAPAELFEHKIFITAKVRELTAEGEAKLTDFTRPTYLAMLDELGKELGADGLEKLAPDERPNELRLALSGKKALIVFDNLETLPEEERTRLFQFLSRLPEGNKAIVTSRRRTDVDARIVRLDRLSRDEAMQLIDELAKKYPRLGRATAEEYEQLYAITQGNPLFIRWIAGQLGREGSQLRTISEAVAFIDKAPKNNDPLEYIFGDLLETFKEDETKVLAALTHFDKPAQLKWIAQMTDLPEKSVETALEDLTDRSILMADFESRTFYLPPLTAKFIRTRRPEAVTQTGDALTDRAYTLALQYGGDDNYEGFRTLDAEWGFLSAALPLVLTSDNDRLQTVCDQLFQFLHFTGKLDELIWFSEQAETRAVNADDKYSAGWQAYRAGAAYSLRNQPAEVLVCAARAAEHWKNSNPRDRAFAIQLRGIGHKLNRDYPAAITAFRDMLEIWRSISPESSDAAIALNELADAERMNDDYSAAERDYREALRIDKINKHTEGIAIRTGNLALLALNRKQWAEAESLAREALPLGEKVGRQELIANDCHRLAKALLKQNKNLDEALSMSRRAVEIFTRLRHRNLQSAQETLAEIEKRMKEEG
jgi:tetratricopeptide (TPR) repeat protein